MGLDVSAEAVARVEALGLEARVGTYERMPDGLPRFEMVRLWHVLEHLEQPVEALKTLSGSLLPGGVLVVAVPNIASALYRLFGADWHQLDAPRHVWSFDESTLRRAFDAAGLEVVDVRFAGVGGSIAESMRYALERLGMSPWLPEDSYGRVVEGLNALAEGWNDMGAGDSMVFIGRPRSDSTPIE